MSARRRENAEHRSTIPLEITPWSRQSYRFTLILPIDERSDVHVPVHYSLLSHA